MDHKFHTTRLTRRAFWLIKLRWVAIVATCLMTAAIAYFLNIELQVGAIFTVAGLLVIENLVSLWGLRRSVAKDDVCVACDVRKNIHIQIGTDLLLLTVLLHFTGGVENPFIVYFVFHMAIASSLLTVRESYLQATWAVVLLVALVGLEYAGWISHYSLQGLLQRGFYDEGLYVLGTVLVLASMLYLVIYMTSDIARKLMLHEHALSEANAVLEQQDRIKDEYVARVTHDIKGHLAAIESCQDIVIEELGDPLTPRQHNFIFRAQNRTQTLAKFVRTLLELTRMRLSNHLDMDVFSLQRVIRRVVEACENRSQAKQLDLVYSLDAHVDAVYGHAFSLEETITNLVLNAIKYTPPGGRIEIRLVQWLRGAAIEVKDSGIGIPEEDCTKVFDEFFRASNARDIEKDGTGLGLAIAKQIVKQHDGEIMVESRLGEGSLFRIILPEDRLRNIQSDRFTEVKAKEAIRKENEVRL